jgi:glycosyltransferase involved in cell wall biosynthesis
MTQPGPAATIIIPAHNEERGLPRLLGALLAGARPGQFSIIVVCNGCTDRSADLARGYGADVTVIELAEASKAAALDAGADRVQDFPVVFIDADVSVGTADISALIARLRDDVLAAAPRRLLVRDGVSRAAGWYYDVWERLPQVRAGLFGRGVIALSAEGYNRVRDLPHFIADDAAFSEAFSPGERTIAADAAVSVWPARTWESLLTRRVRAIQGMRELRAAGGSSAESQTSIRDLAVLLRREPELLPRIAVFVWATLRARAKDRRVRSHGDAGWMRDESSRSG